MYEPVPSSPRTREAWAKRRLFLSQFWAGKRTGEKGRRDRARLGYHAGCCRSAHEGASVDDWSRTARRSAAEIPLVGFYLQPAVGGIHLPANSGAASAKSNNVIAIKIAPFNRYRTLSCGEGVVAARAEDRVTLYTGNADHIVSRSAEPVRGACAAGEEVRVRIKGGLLGHWSVWTKCAVELLERIQETKPRKTCWRSTPRSLTPTARSSTSRTILPAASQAATRCCGGRDCSKASGASTRRKGFRRARREK